MNPPHYRGDTLEPEEERLYNPIMAYRQQHSLSPFPSRPR